MIDIKSFHGEEFVTMFKALFHIKFKMLYWIVTVNND